MVQTYEKTHKTLEKYIQKINLKPRIWGSCKCNNRGSVYEMKDRSSVTKMERGGVYEMDRQKKCLKMKMPLKYIKFNNTL